MQTCPINSSLFLSWLRLIWMVAEALDVGAGDSDRAASYQKQMSHWGQTRKWRAIRGESALPRSTDIVRPGRLVRFVPEADLAAVTR